MRNSIKFWLLILALLIICLIYIIGFKIYLIIIFSIVALYIIASLITYYDEYSDWCGLEDSKYNFVRVIKTFNDYLDNLKL